ncbi:MAG: hypothetical protein C4K58_03720 [Flavobacteriaceae bacterium]|nr:MAG: hypothetical protein C4K58_03720 [Flavobacteriaceae bacterium]
MGFIGGISFMESWLKFQAKGVSLEIGLSIGKLVFFALNKIEIILWVSVSYGCYGVKNSQNFKIWIGLSLVLWLQTLYLLPVLDERADRIISGEPLPPSFHHLMYIILEACKLVLLSFLAYKTFKAIESNLPFSTETSCFSSIQKTKLKQVYGNNFSDRKCHFRCR